MKMTLVPTALEGVVILVTEYARDERGFFIETYHRQRFAELGISLDFVQDNFSRSRAGVLRGLHYQDMTAPMAKLVRCTRGAIFDVAVDLRVGSPTFGRWTGVELTEDNQYQLLIPVGFAHGFAVLSPIADVQYKCTNYYVPAAEGAVAWNDADIGVRWPVTEPVLSSRDQSAPTLQQYLQRPAFHFRSE